MNEEMESILLSVAEAVADGMPVDWDGLCEREPAIGEQMARLRAVADVAEAHRQLRDARDPVTGPGADDPS